MENTAIKLSAQEIIKEFSEGTGNLDLLKIFLITNSADIAREYEFMTKLLKNAGTSEADKATYQKACQTLINISLRRISLSDAIYKANDNAPVVEQETIIEKEKSTIMMLPSLEDLLTRVKKALSETTDLEVSKTEAFEALKTTVGQGKVLNADGKPEIWDNERINIFITDSLPVDEETEEVKPGEKFGFETIYQHTNNMSGSGKTESEIKESLKIMLLGKVVGGKDPANDTLIKDDKIFEDFYNRMLISVINIGIKAYENSKAIPEGKLIEAEKAIEAEIKPVLEQLDKDEKETSLNKVAKLVKDIYAKFHFKKTYGDSLDKAKELAETAAPNLLKRNKETTKGNMPITPIEKKNEPTIEIYDESHNIQESNKPLWAEVEKYEYLTQLFTKAVELSKAGFWRDALSMCIILISSGKIKETETSTEFLKWDQDQIKLWYHGNVEIAVSGANETPATIDTVAEIINDNKDESAESTEKPAESSESSQKVGEETKEVKQGPVPQAGAIESKEGISRLLKDSTLWKDTYSFKSFLVKTDHHRGGAMSLEIVDATKDQEKDLLITEHNMTKFFDDQRDKLVEVRNNYPKVKEEIYNRLSAFYEISHSEVNRILTVIAKEADELRKEAKKASKTQIQSNTENKLEETNNPPVELPVTKENDVNQSTENSEIDQTENSTENVAGESPSNSSNTNNSYEGFEDIVKAKDKFGMHKAVFAKVSEYSKPEDGIKAVFEVINVARKDHHYKKAFIRNYKAANTVDLLSAINNIVTAGTEASKSQ